MRRVFDCFMYNGEIDVLTIRLNELNDVVDKFVLVEANETHSGLPREICFDPTDPKISKFANKIRRIIVKDLPEGDPFVRDASQRNGIMRGLSDAEDSDIVVISDVDEIPQANVISRMVSDGINQIFGLKMPLSYFYVNYRLTSSVDARRTWTTATICRNLNRFTPNDIRILVMSSSMPARIFENAGWHFSYLADTEGVKNKIKAFAHQEFNTPEYLNFDIDEIVRKRQDIFNRPEHKWEIVTDCDLPVWLKENDDLMSRVFYRK